MSVFKEIPGYEGYYEIDRNGNVRSIKRVIKTKKGTLSINSRSITPRSNNYGYLEIRLSKAGFTKTKFKKNATISLDENDVVCIVSDRAIKMGEEIFCSYGKSYWKNFKNKLSK